MLRVTPIPEQDHGYLINVVQLPPGTTLDRTENVVRRSAVPTFTLERLYEITRLRGHF
jgi:multidrug efflux pump subunit AcrB